ncbi:hypothetical protein [uncultured Methanobrevibacter sp.]|uniref:hypothetical protein n=1 Tax=uncultured Methanobrevibacter sp. TaxID=253161 RepID=UPI0025F1A8DE|nr:hypothetical protein [uncultured Methanobrevibacter sp.]MBR4589135.1 hypothetical protein [Bacteroidaceae bacterium]
MDNLKSLKDFISEDVNMTVNVNPNMNIQGMGDVTMTSGDLCGNYNDSKKYKKKRKKLKYIKDMPNFWVNEIK